MTAALAAKPRSRRMLETMLSAAASHISSTVLLLAVTPFLLRAVGLENYGFWALLGSLSRYYGIANFGIGPALTKYTAEYVTRREPEKIRQMTTFGVLFYLGIGLLVVPPLLLLGPHLAVALHLSPKLAAIAPELFIYFAVLSAYGLASSTLGQLLIGYGLFDAVAGTTAIAQVVFIIVAGALLLLTPYKLMALVIAATVQMVLLSLLPYLIARRKFGRVFANPFTIRSAVIKPLFKMGGWIQLSSAMVLILFETQQLLVGLFVGVSAIGLYDVGSKLARGVRALSYYFSAAMLPMIATLEAESGRARAESTFAKSARYVGLVSFSVMGLLIAAGPFVVALWLGKHYHAAVPTVVLVVGVLSATYVIDNITAVGVNVRRALGLTKLEAIYTGTGAATTILASFLLAPKFGVAGIVWGTALGTALGSIVFLTVFTKVHHVHVWRVLLLPVLQLLAATLLAAGAFWLTARMLPPSFIASRLGMLVALFLGGASYVVALGVGLRIVRFFDSEDLAFIQRTVSPRVGRVFRLPIVRALFAAG